MSPTILVASPRQIGSMPVASGSRLPAWPAFSPPRRRRTRCRAAFEERPCGLSSSRIPLGMGGSAAAALAVGAVAVPGAIGGDRAVDETGETRGAFDTFVDHELEPRRMPQAQPPAELA